MRSSLRFLQSFVGVSMIAAIGACSTFGGGAEQGSGNLAGQAGRVANLEASIEAQSREIDRIVADQTEMSRQVDGLDRAVRELRADLNALAQSASGDSSAADVTDLKDRLTGLESQIARVSTEVSAIDQSVRELEANRPRNPVNEPSDPDPVANTNSVSDLDGAVNGMPAEESEAFAVHLASYRDASTLESGWQTLQDRYADFLGPLEARVSMLDLDDFGGRFYRLVAGPIDSREEAVGYCDRLHADDGYCEVTRFSGQRLDEVAE